MQMRHRTRRWAGALAAAIGIAIIATGCASPAQTTPASDAPTELSIATLRQPQTFDLISLSDGQDAFIWSSIYDTLLRVDSDGTIIPNAASAWEYSEDGLTLTLTLRDDLEFSNGDPVTSSDVQLSLDTIRTTPGSNQSKLANIESIDVPDASTVVISLSEIDPSLLSNLTYGVGAIANPDTIDEPQNPIGSGPYTLNVDETVAGATYVLDRRADYWDLDAYPFEKVTVKVVADPTATENALRSGELDIASVPPTSLEALEGAGYDVVRLEASNIAIIKLIDREGTIVPALADVRVRQAINMAFDRQGIVDGPLYGAGLPTEQLFAPGQPGYVEELNDTYEFDVDGAKELLTEAGYPDGFAVTMPALVYTAAIQPTITQSLADIGITVNWESVPPQDTASAMMGKFAMALWFDGINTPGRIVSMNYAPEGFANAFHTTDPELTALLDEYSSTVDLDAQTPILEQINEFAVENAWDAPVYFGGQDFAVAEGYTYLGTSASQFSTLRLFGVAE